ncbi:putative major capsid protein [Vibrio phage vB_VcorM_GR11A]|nr:putative major capsid protein [Vibrio phage vB_VcorM_GR11A]
MKRKLQLAGVQSSRPTVVTDLTLAGTNQRLVGQNGEFNVANNQELLQAVAQVMQLAGQGRVVTEAQATQEEAVANRVRSNRELVQAAFDDKEELIALGEVLAEDVQITQNRDGFMRRFMAKQEIEQGQIPQIRVNQKNVAGVLATSASQTHTQLLRDNMQYPNEFYVTARPFIEQKDISRSTTDILEEKYIDTLEAIMVQEDRIWKQMADETLGLANEFTNIVGTMNTTSLAQLINRVTRWGLPAKYWLIANDIWTDVISDSSFVNQFNATSYAEELVQTGTLGNIYGLEVVSDQFRHEAHKVLEAGEMYILSSPEYHGQFTDRDGLDVRPIDDTHENVPGRGWVMTEQLSMAIVNARTVAKARRQ